MAPSPPPTRLCPRCGVTYPGDAAFCPADGTALTSPRKEDPYLGTVVGKDVELREVLGAGAMGKVYRGHQHGTGRDVAVKILHDELSGRSQLVQRFYREAKIAGRLRHPHVVEVYFTGDIPNATPPASYIVMEFLEGRNLQQELVACGGKVPLERAIGLVLQMCDAVGEGHRQGIVHRDLKPENVMLARREGRSRDFVKVLDFGIARASLPNESMETAAGAVFGTARYISPEGAQGLTATPASDVYSLAVMLYQLVSGKTPFDAEGTVGLLLKHVHELPPPLASLPGCEGLPMPVCNLVMACLDKSPEKRPADGRSLGAALVRAAREAGLVIAGADRFDEHHETGEPPLVRPSGAAFVAPTLDDATPPPAEPPRPAPSPEPSLPVSASPKVAGKIAIALGAFVAGVAIMGGVMHRMTPEPAAASPEDERKELIERTRMALSDGHYMAPPGNNVNELTAAGLKKWPKDSDIRRLRSEAGQELVTMAMTERGSGDVVGARNHAREATTLDPTDNSAKLLAAQLDDDLKAIAAGPGATTGAPRLVFEAPRVIKAGNAIELFCRVVPGSAGAKAKIGAVRISLAPTHDPKAEVTVSITSTDPANVRARATAPKALGTLDLVFETTVDGVTVRAIRDLDVIP